MKGARAVAGGLLVLALVCAVPAVSAAQDAGSTDPSATTTTDAPAPDPLAPSAPAASPGGGSGNRDRHPGGDAERGGESQAPVVTTAAAEPASAPSDGPGKARASASASVTMGDNFFSPASVTISVGDIVTWKNKGNAPHTATADDGSFDTGTVASGQNASHMFTSPGTFSYICTIHANMKGTVKVLSAGGNGGGGGGAGAAGSSSSAAPTEAQAVASADAAASSTSLAATGLAAVPLALVGIAMLTSGLTLRYRPISRRIRPGSSGTKPPAATPVATPRRAAAPVATRKSDAAAVVVIGLTLLTIGLLVRRSSR